ncbi:MAG: TIGR00645 family protein [Caulobacteraceae bacterium]
MTEPHAPRGRKNPVEDLLEHGLFNARWLMAPFYVGLVAALLILLVVFVRELVEGVGGALASPEQAILLVLSLIDLSLAGNLILIVTFSGYENFVSKIDTRGSVDRPAWMGTIDFSAMKIKLIASIVAISAISLLRAFMRLADAGDPEVHQPAPDQMTLAWMIGLHLTFVVSGVLFALMDWLSEKTARLTDAHARPPA